MSDILRDITDVNVKVKCRRCHLCGETESSCFSFPKEDERRKAWLLFCNITDSQKISVPYLCEKHFENKLIFRKNKKPGLHGHAVPTIRVESRSTSQDEETEPPKKKRLKYCCVCGPTDSHLHKFPLNEDRRNEWLDSMNMTGDKRTHLLLCNLHFPADCILKTAKGRILLKGDAKPQPIERTNAIDTSTPPTIASSVSTMNMSTISSPMLQHDSTSSLITSTVLTNNGLNQINIGNLRKSLSHLLNRERVGVESMEMSHNDSDSEVKNGLQTKSAELEECTDVELQWEMTGPSTRVGGESMEMSHNDSEMNISNTLQAKSAELEKSTDVELQWQETGPSTSGAPGNMSTPTTSKLSSAVPRKRHIRFLGDINTPSLNSPTTRMKCLSVIRTHRLGMERKLNALKKQNARLKFKVTNMKSLLTDLKRKNMISEDAASSLLNEAPATLLRIIRRKLQGKTTTFSRELMAFALTLQFYSTRAYKYVRQTFGDLLPCLSTLKKRRQRVDSRPGFITEAFHFLKQAAEKHRMAINLCIDDMSIREHIDSRGDRDYGYCDLGTFIGEEGDKVPAKNCLAFLAVNLKQNLRIPVAYFLISSLSGSERANLLRLAITSLHEINVHVKSITFDGASVNTTMCEVLGANFCYKTPAFKPFFPHPITKKNIYVFYDPCHMIKLIRNRFGLANRKKGAKRNYLYDSLKRKISFEEIELLVNMQEEEGIHAANKLTQKHLDYDKKVMNVALAAQVFSASVSSALKLLQNLGEIPQNSGTPYLCSSLNDIFDALNCRSLFVNPFKKPKMKAINNANLAEIKTDCQEWVRYLEGLTDEDGTACYRSGRKIGFLGLIICLQNITALYEDLRDEFQQDYLLSYRILQDYIENFFGCLRARGGFNDNPSALQVEIAIKYLLIHTEIRSSENGNCQWVDLEDLDVLATGDPIPSDSLPLPVRLEIDSNELLDIDIAADDDFAETTKFSPFQQEGIKYITGFAVRKILKNTCCPDCQNLLKDAENENDCVLLKLKNRGYLTVPSKAICKFGVVCESEFRAKLQFLGSNGFFQKTKDGILRHESLIQFHPEHHDSILDFFIQVYFNVRKHYEESKLNRKKPSNRNKRKRITIFQHE